MFVITWCGVLNGICISPNSLAGRGGVLLESCVSCMDEISCLFEYWVCEFTLSVASGGVSCDDWSEYRYWDCIGEYVVGVGGWWMLRCSYISCLVVRSW